MSKITSDDCKDELNRRFPTDGPKTREDWKRLSKTGSAKTSIVRVFQHRSLPLVGTVTEVNGQFTTVTFTTPEQAQAAKSAPAKKTTPKKIEAPTSTITVANNGRAVASDYLFAIIRREEGLTYFAVVSEAYWRQHHRLSDGSFGDLFDGMLPKNTGTATETTFCTTLGKKALSKFMLSRGFKDDERFSQYMDEEPAVDD